MRPRHHPLRSIAATLVCTVSVAAHAGSGDREALRKAVDQMLAQTPLAGAHVSVVVESLDDGQTIYARNADDALNPASNTKLVTAAAALLRLGPEYRFTTDYLADRAVDHGRVRVLYVRGRGDPSVNAERLVGLVADLAHRGIRQIGDVVLDDTFLDREQYGPGWEQETSDKAWAAGVGALSMNHNAVAIYITPSDRVGQRARVEIEPEARDYFILDNRTVTVRSTGRRKLRPHTIAEGERTRITVDGRIPLNAAPVVMYRRIGDPSFYYGQTLREALRQRGIKVTGRVRRGPAPEGAFLLQSYESPELADIVRDMNKASSNFIAEMLVKVLGAELKSAPGTWAKGIEVTEELLAELGIPRGTYTLRNGSGLNDTNRFSARQMASLLAAVWKRFPVASEFIASLGIAARDGTMRGRMEGTDAAGRLRAKTGTLERVTALSGYVQSLGGERFVFSILVNDWAGKPAPVVSSIDRVGGMLAALGAPEPGVRDAALAAALGGNTPVEAPPAEQKARLGTYAVLSAAADKKNLPFLRSALRTERDPMLRVAVADALYRSDPEQGGGPLLETMPSSPEVFAKLRAIGRELSLPVPAVSSLLDLAVDGSIEAIARLLALAPLARGQARDAELEKLLVDGLPEVGEASPDELFAALRGATPASAQAGLELIAAGLEGDSVSVYPFALLLHEQAKRGPGQADAWLNILDPRRQQAAAPTGSPAAAGNGPASSSAAAPAAPAVNAPAGPAAAPATSPQAPAPGQEPAPSPTAPSSAARAPAGGAVLVPPATGPGRLAPARANCAEGDRSCRAADVPRPGGG